MTKKQIEDKYGCKVFKDFGFDNSRKYWVASGGKIEYADGWTLKELVKNIERKLGKQI